MTVPVMARKRNKSPVRGMAVRVSSGHSGRFDTRACVYGLITMARWLGWVAMTAFCTFNQP